MANMATLTLNPVTGRTEVPTRWNRAQRGSADRAQMRLYAAQVAALMAGVPLSDTLPCIHCGEDFTVMGEGDSDRPMPGSDYMAGRVVLTCRACNERRDKGTDLEDVAGYAAAVLAASLMVEVPTCAAARRVLDGFTSVPVRQGMGGPAAQAGLDRSPWRYLSE